MIVWNITGLHQQVGKIKGLENLCLWQKLNSFFYVFRTVLQMPRGNLESIQPRSLTVLLVQNLLNSSRFQDAFLLARRQRINLNLLVDHNIQHFMKNIDKFVEQVKLCFSFKGLFMRFKIFIKIVTILKNVDNLLTLSWSRNIARIPISLFTRKVYCMQFQSGIKTKLGLNWTDPV